MARKTERYIKADKKDFEHEWLIEQFMDYLRAGGKTPKTLKNYYSDLCIWFSWFEKNCKFKGKPKTFDQLKAIDIIKFQGELIEKGMSINRYSRLKSVISSLANYCENILAEDDDYPEFKNFRSPVNKVKKPIKEAVREKTILQDVDIQNLLDQLVENKKYQQACALALAVYSGSRKAELLEFKVNYFKDENLKFGGSLYKTPEKIRTKGKMLEKYVLAKQFKPYFDLWMEERNKKKINNEYLFVKNNNGVYERAKESQLNYYAEYFTKLLDEDFYWHSCRHFWTTSLSQQGLPDAIIKTLTGWQSLEMVSIYKDVDDDEELGKYFDEDGIKQVEEKKLTDL